MDHGFNGYVSSTRDAFTDKTQQVDRLPPARKQGDLQRGNIRFGDQGTRLAGWGWS